MTSLRLAAWFLTGWCLLVAMSCQQRDPEPALYDLVQVSYTQTACADKWGTAATPQQLETAATVYLARQGITLTNAQAIRLSAGPVCYACTCRTGVVLTGQVASAQLAAIQALGFTRK